MYAEATGYQSCDTSEVREVPLPKVVLEDKSCCVSTAGQMSVQYKAKP